MRVKLTFRTEEDGVNQLKEYNFISKEMGDEIQWIPEESLEDEPENVISTNLDMTTVHRINIDNSIKTDKKEIENLFLEYLYKEKQIKENDEFDGFEHEHDENSTKVFEDEKPYDPKKIRIDTKSLSIKYLVDLIGEGDIELSPDFQREFVWTDIKRRSRLIESLMLRIPLPAFYLAQDEDGKFKVVDGMQRLTVINSFINNEFRLKGLEYLKNYEGCFFDKGATQIHKIPDMYKRRIEQTQLFINIIDPDTPSKVKYDIFKRINTGGKELKAQEIRNSLLNAKGREFINKLANSDEFLIATNKSIKTTRMADKEIILRFIAFYLSDNGLLNQKKYKGYMDSYLDDTAEILKYADNNTLNLIESDFIKSMKNAATIFDKKAFRKTNVINKSIYLSMSRVLYKFEESYIESKKHYLLMEFNYMKENDKEYQMAITAGTNAVDSVRMAHEKTIELMVKSHG